MAKYEIQNTHSGLKKRKNRGKIVSVCTISIPILNIHVTVPFLKNISIQPNELDVQNVHNGHSGKVQWTIDFVC